MGLIFSFLKKILKMNLTYKIKNINFPKWENKLQHWRMEWWPRTDSFTRNWSHIWARKREQIRSIGIDMNRWVVQMGRVEKCRRVSNLRLRISRPMCSVCEANKENLSEPQIQTSSWITSAIQSKHNLTIFPPQTQISKFYPLFHGILFKTKTKQHYHK